MKSVYIDYSKQLRRGGNRRNKKDLDAEIKLLEKEGWTVEFGKYGKGENEYFEYWFEATKFEEILENECPRCKSKNIIDIVYGYPNRELMAKAERGEVKLGGCEVDENNPTHFCRDCLKEFGKRSVA